MKQILIFITFTIIGYIVGGQTHINPIAASYFPSFAAFALVVGLYGSVVGIDLNAVRNRKILAVVVITIAVPLQIMATGFVMYLIYPVGLSFLLAVAMTQIDPLSVDTLLQDKDSMSDEAKGLLRIWASFDDPVTVLFGFLILLPLVTGQSLDNHASSYGVGLLLNLVPALILWAINRWTKLLDNTPLAITLLIALLTYSFFLETYLLAAITGLLLRPIPEKYLTKVITLLYYSIVFVVGMAIYSHGIEADHLRYGALLAIVEFFVIQPLTTIIVFNGTPNDLLRIAFAQQNGLTTLLMGIAFQSLDIDVLPILLPAIVIVNILNLVVNKIYSKKEEMGLVIQGQHKINKFNP